MIFIIKNVLDDRKQTSNRLSREIDIGTAKQNK